MPGDITSFTAEELEQLFADDAGSGAPTEGQPPKVATEGQPNPNEGDKPKETEIDQTKAFSRRLSEKIAQEREAIAKTMGFETYDDMIKSKEKKIFQEHGLDEEELAPVIDKLVEQRIANDPRMKELEDLRARKVEEFAKKELAEISNLTNGEITKLEQLPKEVIDLWSQKGSLKSAYLELEGEKLIKKIRAGQSKGQTSHLQNPSGSVKPDDGMRPLNEEERAIWKFMHPGISEEELNKKRTK